MIHAREDHGCTLVQSNVKTEAQVIVVGGVGSDSRLNTVESLQRNSNKWMSKEPIPLESLLWHAVTHANSPEYLLYSIGGCIDTFHCTKTIYGLTNYNTWKVVANLKFERVHHTSLNVQSKDIPGCA